jgi:hypothetical protein
MANKKKPQFVFKLAYQKAKKIAIKNKTLGKFIKLNKEVVRDMALRGKLEEVQLASLFEADSLPQEATEEKPTTEEK